jgi:hypothetical protein
MKWFRAFWTNNMVDKLTLLFLSAELEMDKKYLVCSTTVPDGYMGFKLFLKTYKMIMPDRCKPTLGNNLLINEGTSH